MTNAVSTQNERVNMGLFWGCFIALTATSFGFIARVLTSKEWGAEFGLDETQVGEILGAGLWPFAVSIVLFSLIIDRVGYKAAMWFGLACHVVSTICILSAQDYQMMYIGTFILALGSGTVEAYINPLVASMFTKNKTKWLNILHAGWPGGLVLGGIIIILLASGLYWKTKIAIILIPTAIYALMLWNKKFPVSERVAAGVSYKDMLKEVGAIGAGIIAFMVFSEIGRLAGFGVWFSWGLTALSAIIFYVYTQSLGRPLYILLLLIMMILATTELGVDSWITPLMEGEMSQLGLNAGWVLIYTSLIMMILRFYAGPIVHRLSPLGLLACSAALAMLGLVFLSKASGTLILLAATLYGVGKTFFWPTTLGVVAEQFPKGGALTLNAIAGMGMLAVGTFGNPILGNIQDRYVAQKVQEHDASEGTNLANTYVMEKRSIIGSYDAVDPAKLRAGSENDKSIISRFQNAAKKETLWKVAILPLIMLICYIGLIFYFRSKGGYRPVEIDS